MSSNELSYGGLNLYEDYRKLYQEVNLNTDKCLLKWSGGLLNMESLLHAPIHNSYTKQVTTGYNYNSIVRSNL